MPRESYISEFDRQVHAQENPDLMDPSDCDDCDEWEGDDEDEDEDDGE